MNVGVLLHHMETFGGVVVAITNRYSAPRRMPSEHQQLLPWPS